MPDLRRIAIAACVMLVVLRMSIGWQLFYEGIWKYRTLHTASPWSAEGYLKNSRGPLRDTFRNMAGDPDDLKWLDTDKVAARWDEWQKRFAAHYRLDENDRKRLDLLVNGQPEYVAELEQLPEAVEFRGSLGQALQYDADKKRLIVPGAWHLTPDERDRALALAPVVPEHEAGGLSEEQQQKNEINRKYRDAVLRVYALQSRLGYKEKLKATLLGNPELTQEEIGEIALYRKQLARYENNRAKAEQDFQQEHLQKQFGELQQRQAALIGPIQHLDAELKSDAQQLLTTGQLRLGPVSMPMEQIDWINITTIAALTVLGFLLIAGLFSRFAAAGAALLLLSFYLAMPPWPGVPGFRELPGPEHSYIIDKNLIEVFALSAIAFLPTGSWFGLDGLFYGWWVRQRASRSRPATVAEKRRETPPKRENVRASNRGSTTSAT